LTMTGLCPSEEAAWNELDGSQTHQTISLFYHVMNHESVLLRIIELLQVLWS
jgi:hypothetical protein